MTKKKKKRIFINVAIIILLISVSTIFLIKMNSDNKKEQIKEKNNFEEKSDEIENIEDKKEEETKNDKDKDNKEKNPSSTKKPSNQNSTSNKSSNISSSSNKNSNSNKNTNTNPTSTEKPTSKPDDKPITPPKEDKNDTKRKTIEKTYGVKVVYGDEIGNYKPKGITPTRLTNENEIEDYLNRLNTELAKYPKNFFQDFNSKGMPLTIYLIKSANESFSGFTDYQFMNDIKMTLATNYEFEYTLHHEMMHYIDCYLNIVMYPKTPYEEYETLNPLGFTYGNASTN